MTGRRIAVVGASLAGLRAAQQLRAQGYDDELVIVGAEPHLPYDRPPLSKDYLLGTVGVADLALAEQSDIDELEAQWHLGVPAVRLDSADGRIVLASGKDIDADGVVLATGGVPRRLPAAEGLLGVHVLRTVEDADALRADLTGGAENVVVIGAGFIGAEVAATSRALGLEVTIIEALPVPLSTALGPELGAVCAGLHATKGVRLLTGKSVGEWLTADAGAGRRRVTGLQLSDGQRLRADVVVVGIGMQPAAGWLADSGLLIENGVLTNAGYVTDRPNVVAVGDVARPWNARTGRYVRREHWTDAAEGPAIAVRNLLAGHTVQHIDKPSYFWSDQYGARIQYAGAAEPSDEIRFLEGAPDDGAFVATYHRAGATTAVLAMNSPRLFTRLRRQLAATPVFRTRCPSRAGCRWRSAVTPATLGFSLWPATSAPTSSRRRVCA
jgi:3-phenylpropionate/trans-cinnamate dioxygenase ferredoxin reductase component